MAIPRKIGLRDSTSFVKALVFGWF